MITSIYAHILDEDRKVNAQKFETAFYAKPDLRNVRPPEEPAKSEPATLDLESLVEQLSKVAGAGECARSPYSGASPWQSDPKNRISKPQKFLSKFLKSVRVQLANIHHAAYKNLSVTEAKLPGEGGTKKRCKPRKKACSGAFWRPREDLNLRPHA